LPTLLPPRYHPFAKGSINLITCSSNSGKTRFLTEVVRHRHRFFQNSESIRRVVYVNGNSQDHGFSNPWADDPLFTSTDTPADAPETPVLNSEDPLLTADPSSSAPLQVVSLPLEDFRDLGETLNAYDILVLDDVLQLTDQIKFVLSYGAHHFQLFVFVVTQSCLRSKLYGIVQTAHNIVLLFGNSGVSRLAQHLAQSFFLCSDTKAYLKAIFGLAEFQQDIVLLKLNSVASYRPHSNVLALTRVQGLFEEETPFCYVYPELGRSDQLETPSAAGWTMAGNPGSPRGVAFEGRLPSVGGRFLEGAFVLLPATQVRQLNSEPEDVDPSAAGPADDPNECLKRTKELWDKMALAVEREVEQSFHSRRWLAAKNLARAMLLCDNLCVSADNRTISIRKNPKMRFGIIDFINVATRRAAPGENPNSKQVSTYKPLVDILLKNDVPQTFIVNKLFLEEPSKRAKTKTKTLGRRLRKDPHPRVRRGELVAPSGGAHFGSRDSFGSHGGYSSYRTGFGPDYGFIPRQPVGFGNTHYGWSPFAA